jgi:HPt (histidine-containing phosphotransfer) domain-containing protein
VIVPEIEDVDVAGGIKRVAGNKKLYRDLLTQFAEKQGDAGSQITEALKNNDAKLAERLAHTVKGVAGNLGISKVQTSAAGIEKAVRENDPALSALLVDFGLVLQSQVRTVKAALSSTQTVVAAEPVNRAFDAEAASDSATRLKGLLDACDGDSEEVFAKFRDAVAGKVESSRLNALGDSIRDYDFDSATAKLDQLIQELSLNVGRVTA